MPLSHAAAPTPTSCSAASARLHEPLAGTAPLAGRWLAIEQPGPWGGRALTESHFPHELGLELNHKAAAAGARIALIRRPGHHAEHDPRAPRRVFLADTRPGRTTLWSWQTSDPATLLDLNFDTPAKPLHMGGPLLLICTNAKRDACCALSGRALAGWLAEDEATDTDAIWESDHLGGHRFAPTAVVLPTGFVYGRLDGPTAREILHDAAAGRSGGPHCRGRSTWSRPAQAAELALRAELQEHAADAVVVTAEESIGDDHYEVHLSTADQRFRALLAESPAAEPRPESCGKAFGTPLELRLISLEKDG
ncbi:MAG TPA: sucrase ferredoxin [Actinospica sp.]|jgi:hypothetical protein|nr:sucrase ferredoxin [Actinospica sp.]